MCARGRQRYATFSPQFCFTARVCAVTPCDKMVHRWNVTMASSDGILALISIKWIKLVGLNKEFKPEFIELIFIV
jgi:hypothetical protein